MSQDVGAYGHVEIDFGFLNVRETAQGCDKTGGIVDDMTHRGTGSPKKSLERHRHRTRDIEKRVGRFDEGKEAPIAGVQGFFGAHGRVIPLGGIIEMHVNLFHVNTRAEVKRFPALLGGGRGWGCRGARRIESRGHGPLAK